MIDALAEVSCFNYKGCEFLPVDVIQSWKTALDFFYRNEIETFNIRSCPANTGHGNRAMETPRCLLWDESSGGCDFRKCGDKQTKSPRSMDNRRLMQVGGCFVYRLPVSKQLTANDTTTNEINQVVYWDRLPIPSGILLGRC